LGTFGYEFFGVNVTSRGGPSDVTETCEKVSNSTLPIFFKKKELRKTRFLMLYTAQPHTLLLKAACRRTALGCSPLL